MKHSLFSLRKGLFPASAATALFILALFSGSASAQSGTITPFIEKVLVDQQTHIATAYFGYTNSSGLTRTIAVGAPNNFFTPLPEDRGQPSRFLPGTHHYVFAAVWDYTVEAQITWIIDGKSVTANASTGASTEQTSAFTFQGRLSDSGTLATGTYDMRFTLFDAATGGTQVGSPVELTGVAVEKGLFTVQLDFGASPFDTGSDRYIQTEVRKNSGDPYTPLSPRQQVTAVPYATRAVSAASADTAVNAQQLNGTSAGLYVKTDDTRLTDARTPSPGSTNYIQNSTSQQASSNFNISGSGTIGGNLNVSGTLNAALGQSSTTAVGDSVLNLSGASAGSYTLVPGLLLTVNVPAGSIVLIATEGGIETNSTTYQSVDVALFIDNLGPLGPFRRFTLVSSPYQPVSYWSMSVAGELSAGSHTIEVRARNVNVVPGTASVSGDSSSPRLGLLRVMVIKK